MQLNITGFTEAEALDLIMAGLTVRKARLEAVMEEILRQLVAPAKGRPAAKLAPKSTKGASRGPMSEEAKAKIVAAQKKRWAKFHRDKKAAAKVDGPAPVKRTRKASPPPPVEEAQEAAVQ